MSILLFIIIVFVFSKEQAELDQADMEDVEEVEEEETGEDSKGTHTFIVIVETAAVSHICGDA